jgi:pimeloyl-ACP methyl ester carboxylesterase
MPDARQGYNLAMLRFSWRILLMTVLIALPRPQLHGASSIRPSPTDSLQPNDQFFSEPAERREVVFLVHGIGKGRTDMLAMQSYLRRQGFEVVNWRYPSRSKTLEQIADLLDLDVERYPDRRVSFVTHSMGGIVVRTYLSKYHPAELGRVVMIAPPNQGAYLADLLGDFLPYKWILGPAGQQLRQGDRGKCACAGVPCCEFGIIAGGTGGKIGMNPLVPGDNDGTVSVASTKLEGATDFLVLPYAHPIIQMMPRTGKNVIAFLRTGKFADHYLAAFSAADTLTTLAVRLHSGG